MVTGFIWCSQYYLHKKSNLSSKKTQKNKNKTGILEKASNEDTGPDFLFAQLKPEGANWRFGNIDLLKKTLNYNLGWKINHNKTALD